MRKFLAMLVAALFVLFERIRRCDMELLMLPVQLARLELCSFFQSL